MRGLRTGLLALTLTVALPLGAASAASAAVNYTALGDSFSSGNGTGVFYLKDWSCHRSPDAYPPLVAAKAGDSLTFVACSGATTSTVIADQLSSLSAATNLVTITVGGNDAGFAGLATRCVLLSLVCQVAISRSDSFIRTDLPGRLASTYADIRAAAPNAHVVVLGYPRPFTALGTTCQQGNLTSLNEILLNRTANLLDGAIANAVAGAGAGFTFVDPRAAFSPHELCSSSPWLRGLTFPAVFESFHPNIAGEAALASLVENVLP